MGITVLVEDLDARLCGAGSSEYILGVVLVLIALSPTVSTQFQLLDDNAPSGYFPHQARTEHRYVVSHLLTYDEVVFKLPFILAN